MSPVQPAPVRVEPHRPGTASASDVQAERLAEQLRVVKRKLLRRAPGTGPNNIPRGNLIMIASALPGEGKSFIARNLALSISTDHDHTVVLVDGDFRKPHITGEYGLEGAAGFLDVMSGKVRMPDAIYSTDQRGLAVLPVGTGRHDVNELLASRRTAALIEQYFVANSKSIVIIDTSPILCASEPQVIAKLVGQTVIVVRAGSTPHSALRQAITDLGDCANCAMVLNDADVVPFSSNYPDLYGSYGSTSLPPQSERPRKSPLSIAGRPKRGE
jgi:protein-tyrosine kinase